MLSQINQRLAGRGARRQKQLRSFTYCRIPVWDAALAITIDLASESLTRHNVEEIQVAIDGDSGNCDMFVLRGIPDGDAMEFGV